MTVRATWNGTLLAESDQTILVEGNQYFPPGDVVSKRLQPNDTHTHCPWKGDASYYDVVADGEHNPGAAWYYPEPLPGASTIRDYVAFWKGVEVSGSNENTPEVRPPGR
ncbi:MAG: DUF427 domain-containing protein [Actinomycetota bacterium]|nr:DUF427 domain-containing protein [Actinomycetota bacterium]